VKVSESERECIVLLLVPSRIVNCESMWRIASGRGGRVKIQVSRLRLASQSDLKSDTCADSTCSYTAVHLRVRFIYERTYVPLPLPNMLPNSEAQANRIYLLAEVAPPLKT
jgi:hypothetical protein